MADDLTFDLCDTSSAVAPPEWQAVIDAVHLHQLWQWSVVRAARAETGSAQLAGVFCAGGRPIGLATARLHGLGRRRPLAGLVDVDCVGTGSLPGIALPGVVSGSLDPSGVDPELLAAALHAFEGALRREFGWRVPAVAYRQVHGRELSVVARGATAIREGASIGVLRNVFADYEAYARSLARDRRKSQRRLVRSIDADPRVTVYLGPAAGAGLDAVELHALIDATDRRNHRARWPPPRLESRDRVAAVLRLPDTVVGSYTDPDGRLIAANITFDHPLAPIIGAWGARPLGPDTGRRSGLWFDHYDRILRWCIEAKRPLMIGGKTLAGLKAELGLTPVPQWTVVRRLGVPSGRGRR